MPIRNPESFLAFHSVSSGEWVPVGKKGKANTGSSNEIVIMA